jgi:glycine cleavage system pyridoxal-binding protein P
VRCPKKATQINRVLLARGILGGIPLAEGPLAHTAGLDLENCMLICVTEVNSKEDIDALIAGLEAAA